ncbi:PQQ-binding-like beta-propeller repeat protein [Natrialba sp. SSL1]|uniref:outer membrane protein assembly factor BamB family protein n=1 Tax=Natrialba sp. SSL1 TaxID=1869245 RepID=UPI0008F84413|nr:PQQ-binding-like beta-propeller repeat protein [Natrialba sp. SSL1]OIB56663.1 hypothetical protein BBD46_16905 [Natrialba sp. SSL1]
MKRRLVLATAGATLVGGCSSYLRAPSNSDGETELEGVALESGELTDWTQPRRDAQNRAYVEEGDITDRPQVRREIDHHADGPDFLGPILTVDGVAIFVDNEAGGIVGFDLETFEEVWTRSIDSPQHLLKHITASSEAIFVTAGNELYRRPLDDDGTQWEADGLPVSTPPVYADGLVLTGQESGTGQVVATNAVTGETEWNIHDVDVSPVQPACTDELCVHVDLHGQCSGFELETGDERWSAETDMSPSGPPVIGDGILVSGAADEQGVIERLDPADGDTIDSHRFDEPIEHALAYAEDKIYAVDASGVLHCLDTELDTRWTYGSDIDFNADGWAERSPIVVGETVWYAGPDLNIHGVDTATGEQRWTIDFYPSSPAPFASAGSALLLARGEGLQILAP